MASTARFRPVPLTPARVPIPSAVFRYDGESGTYTPLRSLVWTNVRWSRGPQPPTAAFRYRWDVDPAYHVRFEDVLPLERGRATHPEAVKVDDRLVVAALTPKGKLRLLFDGFVVVPSASVGDNAYMLPVQATGVGVRLWDRPVRGSVRRWMSALDEPNGSDYQTDLPARVNPDGKPNATGDPDGDGAWDSFVGTGEGARKFPVFADALYPPDNLVWPSEGFRHWDLGMLTRYVLAQTNADEEYVENPDFGAIDDLLKAVKPAEAGQDIDPEDESSFRRERILCRDAVVSDRKPLDVIWEQVAPHGFAFAFRLEAKDDGTPRNFLEFYRERDNFGASFKEVPLADAGSSLPVSSVQPAGFTLSRDASQVINAYAVTGRADEVEVSVVLAPGFVPDLSPDPDQYKSSNPDPEADRDKYRLWIADEAGEGYYDKATAEWRTKAPLPLGGVFLTDDYVVRRRPGIGELVSKAESGNRHKYQVAVLDQYDGPDPPCVWEGQGTPYPVKGAVSLLKDRLGIRVTASNPSAFTVGSYYPGGEAFNGGVLNLVEMMAGTAKWPYFLLTVKIPSDQAFEALADRRDASPSKHTVLNRVEAGDRYKRELVHKSSFFFDSSFYTPYARDADGNEDKDHRVGRDDTEAAKAYAESLRSMSELPSFGGSVSYQGLVNYLRVGDRVTSLGDRLDLRCNLGETPRYPVVVGLQWTCDGDVQTSEFYFDDLRAEGLEPT